MFVLKCLVVELSRRRLGVVGVIMSAQVVSTIPAPDILELTPGMNLGEPVFGLDPSSDGMQRIAGMLAPNDLVRLTSIAIAGHGSSSIPLATSSWIRPHWRH